MGSDENLFRRTVAEGYDCLLCFDYRTLEFDYSLLDGYREIRLLAWSMGVWVAGQILSGRTYPWEMKLAVNGTPFPIDDRRGIAEAVFTVHWRIFRMLRWRVFAGEYVAVRDR